MEDLPTQHVSVPDMAQAQMVTITPINPVSCATRSSSNINVMCLPPTRIVIPGEEVFPCLRTLCGFKFKLIKIKNCHKLKFEPYSSENHMKTQCVLRSHTSGHRLLYLISYILILSEFIFICTHLYLFGFMHLNMFKYISFTFTYLCLVSTSII